VFGCASDRDGDLPSCASGFEAAHGVGDFGERVRLADDRSRLAGLDEPAQRLEVGLTVFGDERRQSVAHERREGECTDLPADAGPCAASFAPDDDQGPLEGEGPPEPRETAVPADVEDQVVAPDSVGEVLSGVVDDMVGPDRADQIDLSRVTTRGRAVPGIPPPSDDDRAGTSAAKVDIRSRLDPRA
jgi:hypothetical protein